jgi:subtilase family serine protease
MKTKTVMTRRSGAPSPRTALTLAVVIALSGIGALNASAGTFATVAHPTMLQQGDAVIGALPMTQRIHIEVALKMRDRDGLDAFIANNAKNQAQGVAAQLMTPAQFLAEHAPTQAQAQAVANYLTSMGYSNVVIAPNRLLVSADGTARTARDAFMTTFAQVRTHDGRIAFANTDEVRIPAALSDKVLAVLGLQSVHQAHTYAKALPQGSAHTLAITGHYPTEFSSIYGGASSVVASGTNVGIITEGSLTQTQADLAAFATNQGLPPVTTLTVNTNGTSTDTANTDEWDLDSQDVVGMAGGQVKKLIFYNIPSLFNSDMVADFNTVVTRNETKIINVSLGECETGAGPSGDGSAAAADAIFANAVAQGQTFSVSTGDSGADECHNSGTNTPSWPANSQYVIAAAGTRLNASTTTWSGEVVWTYSGGSPSTYEPMPSWQTAFGVTGTTRGVADIAFDADPASGAIIILDNSLAQFGGTSLAAPLFAGQWARVLQTYPTIGFAGPVIYALPESAFRDVRAGTNSGGEAGIGYTAGVGYDFASGRGSMITSNLITDSAGLGNKPPVANWGYSSTGLTANFTDASTDSDGTIVRHAWTFGDGSTTTSANPTYTYAANGTYSVTETVWDKVGAHAFRTQSVTVASTGPQQLLGNTGFESGTSPWVLVGATALVQCGSSTFVPDTGSCLATLNGGTTASTATATQTVTIPSGKASATLALRLHVNVQGTQSTSAVDRLDVRVYDSAGNLLGTLQRFTNLNASTGYVTHSLNMTPYIGRTVKIQFDGVAAGLPTQTVFELDNVTLNVQ